MKYECETPILDEKSKKSKKFSYIKENYAPRFRNYSDEAYGVFSKDILGFVISSFEERVC
jgi:hypothetical protein